MRQIFRRPICIPQHNSIYLFQYKPRTGKVIALESLELEIIFGSKHDLAPKMFPHKTLQSPADNLILGQPKDEKDEGQDAGFAG